MSKGKHTNDPLLTVADPPQIIDNVISMIRLHLEHGRYREAHAVIDYAAQEIGERMTGIAKRNLLLSRRSTPREERKKFD